VLLILIILHKARAHLITRGFIQNILFGIHNGIPVVLAAPSIFSIYGNPPKLKNSLVLGISQSGESPDIVEVVKNGTNQGVPTLVITNAPGSPLAQAADYVIDIKAGEERAVAATKTYTAQLMAIAMLSVALSGDKSRLAELERVHEYVEYALALEPAIRKAIERYYYMNQCVVLGRGYNYATAFEWALKLKELVYVVAEPYSSADFLHGPIAIVEQGFPVMVVVNKGAVFEEMLSVINRLKDQHRASVLVISNHKKALAKADIQIPLPEEMPEWISPLVSIVPAQLFCYWLTKLKGFDPEAPRRLTKVTKTK
jgi:glucosamine--fructose-6-phosphate aminotransferase (isomerizing)